MFYTPYVDIASVKSMWNFLKEHFTYYTMNSWNGGRSIAHNVKLYKLKLEGDYSTALSYLYDAADSGGLQFLIADEIDAFETEHPAYKVGFNGRSGGYLVLYNADNHKSVLPPCVDDYDTYEDFKKDIKGPYYGYKVSDFDRELRDVVLIVREFDKLCDRLRDLVNEYSKRSYDTDKLDGAIESFNLAFGDDLDSLGLDGPVLQDDKVELNCLTKYQAFMHCFLECLGEDRRRAQCDKTHLWLKEN